MSAPDDETPWAESDPRVAAALAADPTLAEELDVIVAAFDPAAAERFRTAFAEELDRHARPATAVLTALERAASSRDA